MMILARVMEIRGQSLKSHSWCWPSVSRVQSHYYLEELVRKDTQSLCQRMLTQEVGRELRILHIFLNLC